MRNYKYDADVAGVGAAMNAGDWNGAYEMLAEPLHEALYAAQDFTIMDGMSVEERLILSFDYVRNQVLTGGFIQLIQNNYIRLLVPAIEGLQQLSLEPGMISLLDDVLRVYVLNRESLDRETSVEEFGKLYEEFREFETLDDRFSALQQTTVQAILQHVTTEDKE